MAYPRPSLEQACVSEGMLTTYVHSDDLIQLTYTMIGGKCGSTTIDRALHRLMEKRFGSLFSSLSYQKTGAGSKFMTQFESFKRDFGVSKRSRQYLLDLNLGCADSKWYSSDENEVIITT